MRIDIEDVVVHKAQQALWNSYDIDDVVLYKNGEPFTPDPELLKELKFTGLSNVDVITILDEDNPEPVFDDGPFNGLVPNNLDEAVEQILTQLTPANCSDISMVDGKYSSMCLNGMAIRNDWNLWGKSNLSLWFAEHGIYHADDMSAVIADTVWCIVNQVEPTPIEEHKKVFDAHWEKYGCDVKDEFEKRCNG